jgi:hypothetical protein
MKVGEERRGEREEQFSEKTDRSVEKDEAHKQ